MFEGVMKTKIAIVVLAVVCAGLGVALVATKKQNDEQRKKDADAILDFSNQLVTASENLDELRQVNLRLTNDFAVVEQQVSRFTNSLNEASSVLATTKATLQNAQDQIANLNGRIADLEAQNRVLDDRANTLSNTIAALNSQIADTERRLANSETNNAFLEKELQQQIAQRAELQRKFDDLNEVRAQVKKLRGELFAARRLELMRNSAPEQKGAQLLVQPRTVVPGAIAAAKPPPHYDLNVEVGSDGSVRIIPPLTNMPEAAPNSPSR
jgi:chromosome segregation ATPase